MAALDLRPLSLGELLDRTFFLYRRNFLVFAGISALPYALLLILVLVPFLFMILARPGHVPAGFQLAGLITAVIFVVAAIIVGIVAFLYSAGATVFAVSEIYSGRKATIRQSFRLVRGKAGTIFGVGILSMLILIAGFIALIIPGLYLLCRVPVATAAASIEDLGPADGIQRSFALTQGFAGRAAMIYGLAFALSYGVSFMIQMPFFVLIALSAKNPQLAVLWTMLMQAGSLLGSLLVAPVHTIGFALYYYDLRVRKEAFDLQMMMQSLGGAPAAPPITGGMPSLFGRDAS
jgi:hypothetical protein